MQLTPQRNLEDIVRANLFFNKIDQSQVCNVEIFLNTVVIYGQDHDTRVLEFIRKLEPLSLSRLTMVQLAESEIRLYWNSIQIPANFVQGKFILLQYSDGEKEYWKITESRQVCDLLQIKEKILLNVTLN